MGESLTLGGLTGRRRGWHLGLFQEFVKRPWCYVIRHVIISWRNHNGNLLLQQQKGKNMCQQPTKIIKATNEKRVYLWL